MVGFQVLTTSQKIEIYLAKERRECVGITVGDYPPISKSCLDLVGAGIKGSRSFLDPRLEEAVSMEFDKGESFPIGKFQLCGYGARMKNPGNESS